MFIVSLIKEEGVSDAVIHFSLILLPCVNLFSLAVYIPTENVLHAQHLSNSITVPALFKDASNTVKTVAWNVIQG